VAAVALAGPSAASATLAHCEGEGVKGKGASLQELAQNKVWDSLAPEGFNVSLNSDACSGTKKPTVEYTSTGSGPGLESWGQETKAGGLIEYGPKNAYVGSDEPPNEVQKGEMESHTVGGGKVLTIPVLQAAVAVLVHLPKGCTEATSTGASGRMTFSNATLEAVFRGKITKWTELEKEGNSIKPAKCAEGAAISRVVREEGSGTTSIFKKYLNVVTAGGEIEGPKTGETTTWRKLAESAHNTTWPNEEVDPVLKAKKGSGVSKKVAEEAGAGTVGYANVADARPNGFEEPGAGAKKPVFWIELERGEKEGKKLYADPASNKEAAAKGKSDCKGTIYTDGKAAFPPESTEKSWSEVTTALTSNVYPLCGLTYDLSLTKFEGYEGENTTTKEKFKEVTEAAARQVFDYFQFILDKTGKVSEKKAGGSVLISNNQDYESLPTSKEAAKNVALIAEKGAAKITFNGTLFK
jgi:ABC-type phosphate transport system substrate-binding protein